mmetsp:Transcript_22609/g.52178  ORF Transcript_22609/g.52178 Transcript_22609/m.52178 type:complete len:151 (-) Transcript_22609:16-468(-)
MQEDVALLCKAIQDSTVIDKVQNASFRINICHSPDDEVVSFQNVPNVSANPNLHLFELLGFPISGSHFAANLQCTFGEMAPFTSINQGPNSIEILPLENPDTCDAPSSAPSLVPSMAPSTSMPTDMSTGSHFQSMTISVLLISLFLMATV